MAHPRDRRKSRTKPHNLTHVRVGCCCWLLVGSDNPRRGPLRGQSNFRTAEQAILRARWHHRLSFRGGKCGTRLRSSLPTSTLRQISRKNSKRAKNARIAICMYKVYTCKIDRTDEVIPPLFRMKPPQCPLRKYLLLGSSEQPVKAAHAGTVR